MTITLAQFEAIDGLYNSLMYMGDFMECADPKLFIRTSNRLFDACVEAVGFETANQFAGSEDCAVAIITNYLLN